MKYIRTKDGIYDYEYGKRRYIERNVEIPYEQYLQENYNITIIKVADTIEELCDEFVIENCNYTYKPFIFPKYCSTNPLLEIYTHFDRDTICYGAIWTDKGLIYVAKMNEKGELELL